MAIPLDQARALVLAAAAPLGPEAVSVAAAAGRILAGELRARADSPPWANSAMDGFAVTAGPAGRTLRLTGESRAGAPSPVGVEAGTAIRIATGGVIPPGAEAVVPLEQASLGAGPDVTLHVAAAPGRHVRPAGEDMRAGDAVLRPGTRLGPVELAVAISAGHGELACHRRPRVVLLGTGDELRDPGSRLGTGQIHDSNTTALAALAAAAGGDVVHRERLGDDRANLSLALAAAFGAADLVIISGGISAGPHDHVKPALAGLGAEERFWGVKIRPGRPTWFGCRGPTLILGLPGNPAAAIVAFLLLGRPLLAALQGTVPTRLQARLTAPVASHPDRTEVVGVVLRTVDGDGLRAAPTRVIGAHMTTSLVGADGLGLVPPGRGEIAAGREIAVEPLC